MKTSPATKIAILMLLVAGLFTSLGCETARGGAEIWIEGASTGEISMKGTPITGLPSQKVDLVLKVAAKKVNISTTDTETIIEMSPSGGLIVIGPDGMSITGVEPDQMEMRWQGAE